MLISILISVHDGECYLLQALNSLLCQTFQDFEIIVINDASCDGTGRIIEEYAKREPRMRVLTNYTNLGLARSLNLALEQARCEYIARMDADDVSLPFRLEKQLAFMEAHPEVGVLGTAVEVIDSAGQVIAQRKYPVEPILIRWHLAFENPLCHPSVMARKALLLRDFYNPSLNTAQDYDLWSRLAGKTRLANLPDVHLQLRKHGENLTYRKGIQQRENSYQISQKYLETLIGNPISEQDVKDLWQRDQGPSEKLVDSAALLSEAARSILSEPDWSPAERQILRWRTAHVLFETARKCVNKKTVWWQIILIIVRLNPGWVFKKCSSR